MIAGVPLHTTLDCGELMHEKWYVNNNGQRWSLERYAFVRLPLPGACGDAYTVNVNQNLQVPSLLVFTSRNALLVLLQGCIERF
jgi:hypothetical protein